ncbi:Glu/Leu/Phe/Val dehydrogenase dimerization domain-containing protein [Niveibacterium umoris]|uniref:Leucine dehydrogenase n=1 Tax=Niveibacterium umoris TaxID=1193620 RepID=A0A840BKE0_9RHOO|nr:Glu/Leu/Phe/Val dehydrogenase [Niveibacterium umoris]MBB4013725.1 leucine dehydrogenase [Niveibacterium umoris]
MVFTHKDFDHHEQVVYCTDPAAGLRAIIAVHDTALGPALGGCRHWSYASEADALTDALRLSRGMSYKAALAGLPLGGGKSVILANPAADRGAMFEAFGRAVECLGGRYITAEDVGTTTGDMSAIRRHTRHVSGVAPDEGGRGDPSPATALGVLMGMLGALELRFDSDTLAGRRVAVQGLGSVGFELCRLLHERGARLIVADIAAERVERAVQAFGAVGVGVDVIHAVEADVFAPCALGAGLNDATLPQLACSIVAGAANNQLAHAGIGPQLKARGILYAPDYLINAGGLIKVAGEYLGFPIEEAERRVRAIRERTGEVLLRALREDADTAAVADTMACEAIGRAVPAASRR